MFTRTSPPAVDKLRATYLDHGVYNAGLPHFPRNFSRDSFISGILANDTDLLRDQIAFSSLLQGTKPDPVTGEEPGKIHHEYPGVKMPNGLYTTYNACDTSALYLIAHEAYRRLSGSDEMVDRYRTNIEAAVAYIASHLQDGLFVETPVLAGGTEFGLKVTYWKDSQLPRKNPDPDYPIVYTLAHFQNARGLLSAATLLDNARLRRIGKRMIKDGISQLLKDELIVAKDVSSVITGDSSDFLHLLAYIEPAEITAGVLNRIASRAHILESAVGYLSVSQSVASQMEDQYHAKSIWVFEQAMLHFAARKHGLGRVQTVSEAIVPHLEQHPEVVTLGEGGDVRHIGCSPQLWSIAAKHYFEHKPQPVL